jgi:hypothetical protein
MTRDTGDVALSKFPGSVPTARTVGARRSSPFAYESAKRSRRGAAVWRKEA